MTLGLKDQSIARRAIADLDVGIAKAHWESIFPKLPRCADSQILTMLHIARTRVPGIAPRLRVHSHEWLLDRGLPSFLPDEMKPKCEQAGPRVVTGVGISINFRNPILKPIGAQVERAMSDAVLEAAADGKLNDAAHVRGRMMDAKTRTIRKLIGS